MRLSERLTLFEVEKKLYMFVCVVMLATFVCCIASGWRYIMMMSWAGFSRYLYVRCLQLRSWMVYRRAYGTEKK